MEKKTPTSAVKQHVISGQSLLECRAHECIARTRLCEDRKMDVEEGKVDKEWYSNKSDGTSGEVSPEVLLQNDEP